MIEQYCLTASCKIIRAPFKPGVKPGGGGGNTLSCRSAGKSRRTRPFDLLAMDFTINIHYLVNRLSIDTQGQFYALKVHPAPRTVKEWLSFTE